MPDTSLPDEIISEILSPALKVADDAFADTSGVSPFADYSESTSAYLLVCKSWLRVATPLLYNVVVLRSKAQAKALERALAGNKRLGQFIKKLRVEGGYGQPMHTILKCASNVSHLCLTLQIFSPDSTEGLCKGLHSINPTCLILRDVCYKFLKNKMAADLVGAVAAAIPKWDRLCVLYWPYNRTGCRLEITRSLVQAKRLHTIVISSAATAGIVWNTFKTCPLQLIRSENPVDRDLEQRILKKNPELAALLKYGYDVPQDSSDVELLHIAPALNPFFIPMSAASTDVQDTVWSRVLYFAMSVPELAANLARHDIPPRFPLLLVSKTFHRLGLPHFHAHIVLNNTSSAELLESTLSRQPTLGPQIRTICAILGRSYGCPSAEPMLAILSKSRGLVRITGSLIRRTLKDDDDDDDDEYYNKNPNFYESISWTAFDNMTRTSGASLRECSVRIKMQENASPTVFSHLVELRKMKWQCWTTFVCDATAPVKALPKLSDLLVWNSDESFLTALSLMMLPSLRRLVLRCDVKAESFLLLHGSKLSELDIPISCVKEFSVNVLDLCLNVCTLSLSWSEDDFLDVEKTFLSRTPAASLTKMKMRLPSYYDLWEKDIRTRYQQSIATLPQKSLPNLREVWVSAFQWPTSERDIARDRWVRTAESLLARGVSLTDKTGKKWRPRLKARGRSSK
ncbi:hypothetical protein GGX14DRAFT_542380 [Mycena pura]|uniref:Uncharacterized protein n=1 Tax=Mycena pura TaxID=153505 RepID=A0AAD6YCI1_9AGAR|nr:hypothetical protein GGX14DRAFT_542380 [Mycena pura]